MTGLDYTFDGGDSFTNIPYIQEVVVTFADPTGIQLLSWSEN